MVVVVVVVVVVVWWSVLGVRPLAVCDTERDKWWNDAHCLGRNYERMIECTTTNVPMTIECMNDFINVFCDVYECFLLLKFCRQFHYVNTLL